MGVGGGGKEKTRGEREIRERHGGRETRWRKGGGRNKRGGGRQGGEEIRGRGAR